MIKDLLSGLDELGFANLDDLDAFKAEDGGDEEGVKITSNPISYDDYIYDKAYTCVVCEKKFKEKTVKSSKLRFQELDLDLMPKYSPLNPFYYNVVMCPNCGYAALSENFMRITEAQEVLVKNQITPRYIKKDFPFPFTEDTVIERYKFALLNSIVKKGKINERAYICLVISWLYKIKEDEENRLLFVKNAYDAFSTAFGVEALPFFGMNETVTCYLVGELARLAGDNENALRWASRVLSSRVATQKIKDMTYDLKNRVTKQTRYT